MATDARLGLEAHQADGAGAGASAAVAPATLAPVSAGTERLATASGPSSAGAPEHRSAAVQPSGAHSAGPGVPASSVGAVAVPSEHVPGDAHAQRCVLVVAIENAESYNERHHVAFQEALCVLDQTVLRTVISDGLGVVSQHSPNGDYAIEFVGAVRALLASFRLQEALLAAAWPASMLHLPELMRVQTSGTASSVLHSGLRLRSALHVLEAEDELAHVVQLAECVSGGQIVVTASFYNALVACGGLQAEPMSVTELGLSPLGRGDVPVRQILPASLAGRTFPALRLPTRAKLTRHESCDGLQPHRSHSSATLIAAAASGAPAVPAEAAVAALNSSGSSATPATSAASASAPAAAGGAAAGGGGGGGASLNSTGGGSSVGGPGAQPFRANRLTWDYVSSIEAAEDTLEEIKLFMKSMLRVLDNAKRKLGLRDDASPFDTVRELDSLVDSYTDLQAENASMKARLATMAADATAQRHELHKFRMEDESGSDSTSGHDSSSHMSESEPKA